MSKPFLVDLTSFYNNVLRYTWIDRYTTNCVPLYHHNVDAIFDMRTE